MSIRCKITNFLKDQIPKISEPIQILPPPSLFFWSPSESYLRNNKLQTAESLQKNWHLENKQKKKFHSKFPI